MFHEVFNIFFGEEENESTGQQDESLNLDFSLSNDPVDATSGEVPQKRKRGRPPKTPGGSTPRVSYRKNLFIQTNESQEKLTSLDFNQDAAQPSTQRKRSRRNSEGSRSGTPSLSRSSSRQYFPTTPIDRTPTTRRSTRGKHIDIHKPLIFVMPDTNIRELMNFTTEVEMEEFQLALNEDNSGDWSDDDAEDHHQDVSLPVAPPSMQSTNSLKTEVFTPSVKTMMEGPLLQSDTTSFDFDLRKDKSRFTSPTKNHSSDNYSVISSLHHNPFDQLYQYAPYQQYYEGYFDYDCSEEDMLFVDAMKQRLLSASTLENYHLQKEFLTSMNEIMNYRVVELMISRLEKELELIISQLETSQDCSRHYSGVQTSLQTLQHLFSPAMRDLLEEEEKQLGGEDLRLQKEKEEEDRLMAWVNGQEIFDPSIADPSTSLFRTRADSIISLPELLSQAIGSSNKTSSYHTKTADASNPAANRPVFTTSELQSFFPASRVMTILLPIIHRYILERNPFRNYLKHPLKQLIGGEIEIDWHQLDTHYYQTIETFCQEIVSYWIGQRAQIGQSFLRGYHSYMMHLWKRCEEGTVPFHRDYSKESLQLSHQQLSTIRKDLNRARLIVDRVRRREKLKKELLRCSGEHLLTNILQIPSSQEISGAVSSSAIDFSLTAEELGRATGRRGGVQSRSLSIVSDGGLSLEGMGGVLPRKRGRPKRLPSLLTGPEPQTGSSNSNSNTGYRPVAPVMVKFVQGRDKNGKFLKKAPVMISPPSLHMNQNSSNSSNNNSTTTTVTNNCPSNSQDPHSDRSNPSNERLESKEVKAVTGEEGIVKRWLRSSRDVSVPALPFSLLNCPESELMVEEETKPGEGEEDKGSSNNRSKPQKKSHSNNSSSGNGRRKKRSRTDSFDSEEGTTMSCHSSESLSLLSM